MSSTADDQTQATGKLTRRQMLGRTAAAGAVAWSAPLILSSTAHAAGTLGGNLCPDGSGRLKSLSYVYAPNEAWVWDVCSIPGKAGMAEGRSPIVFPSGTSFPTINLVVTDKGGNNIVTGGGPYIGLTGGEAINLTNLGPGGLQQPEIKFWIFDASVVPATDLSNLNQSIATVTVHTSCSQALCVGDIHGTFKVTGGA